MASHIGAVARATALPILVHDDPDRTRVVLSDPIVRQLLAFDTVVGWIDAAGQPERILRLQRDNLRALAVLGGRDETAVAFNAAGGRGCLSAVASLAPAICRQVQRACCRGHWALARELHHDLLPLMTAIGSLPALAGVKRALSVLRPGFSAATRLPIVEASVVEGQMIQAAIDAVGCGARLVSASSGKAAEGGADRLGCFDRRRAWKTRSTS